MEVIHIRYNTKYVTVMAASYAAIVGRNSDEVRVEKRRNVFTRDNRTIRNTKDGLKK
jgi:hypothetical protein